MEGFHDFAGTASSGGAGARGQLIGDLWSVSKRNKLNLDKTTIDSDTFKQVFTKLEERLTFLERTTAAILKTMDEDDITEVVETTHKYANTDQIAVGKDFK